MNYLRIPEIISKLKSAANEKEAAEIVSKNNTPAFRTIVDYSFGPYTFRQDIIPANYTPKKAIDHMDMSLYAEARRLYIWLEDSAVKVEKQRSLLLDLLEGLPHDEAELVMSIIGRGEKEEGFYNVEFLRNYLKAMTVRPVLSKNFNEVKFVAVEEKQNAPAPKPAPKGRARASKK